MSRHDGWGVTSDGSSLCNVHNLPVGGFSSYTVKCGHPQCRATFTHTFSRPRDDAGSADYSTSMEALAKGWGMTPGKSLRCHAHAKVEREIVLRSSIAASGFSSDQIILADGTRIPMPPEYSATVRAMRGKRVKITITIDE